MAYCEGHNPEPQTTVQNLGQPILMLPLLASLFTCKYIAVVIKFERPSVFDPYIVPLGTQSHFVTSLSGGLLEVGPGETSGYPIKQPSRAYSPNGIR